MKKCFYVLLLALASGFAFADEYVQGYIRSDGTYVAPHFRSNQNSFKFDNYSSSRNVNPYTGKRGSGRNEFTNPPSYNRSFSGGGYGNDSLWDDE